MVENLELAKAAVDDILDAVDGQRGLSDVGTDDDFARVVGSLFKNLHLLFRG